MRKLWISLLLSLLGFLGYAQGINGRLYDAGFENVQVKEQEDSLKIFFEHREFRSPFHSMRYAELLLKGLPQLKERKLVWVPVYHDTPVGEYIAGDHEFLPLNPEDRSFFKENNKVLKNYRISLRLYPEVKARFGFYSDPFQSKINLILDSRIYLASGLSLQGGLAIPLHNNLDTQDRKLRAAPVMLHYFAQPWNGHFFLLSAGSFYSDRYGLDLEYRHAGLDSSWSYGLEGGVTGIYQLEGLSLYHTPMSELFAVADVEYRLPIENLNLRLSAGQFAYSDLGARFDVIRQYGNVDIGLFAARTQNGTTGGFQFAFSIFPGNMVRGRNIELRTAEEFRWEYTYNNESPVGQKFRIGMPRLGDLLRQYKAGFIQSLKK